MNVRTFLAVVLLYNLAAFFLSTLGMFYHSPQSPTANLEVSSLPWSTEFLHPTIGFLVGMISGNLGLAMMSSLLATTIDLDHVLFWSNVSDVSRPAHSYTFIGLSFILLWLFFRRQKRASLAIALTGTGATQAHIATDLLEHALHGENLGPFPLYFPFVPYDVWLPVWLWMPLLFPSVVLFLLVWLILSRDARQSF